MLEIFSKKKTFEKKTFEKKTFEKKNSTQFFLNTFEKIKNSTKNIFSNIFSNIIFSLHFFFALKSSETYVKKNIIIGSI